MSFLRMVLRFLGERDLLLSVESCICVDLAAVVPMVHHEEAVISRGTVAVSQAHTQGLNRTFPYLPNPKHQTLVHFCSAEPPSPGAPFKLCRLRYTL